MKTLKVNDGIMGNKFVFILYQATPTTTNQISEHAILNKQNQIIIHLMGNDQTIIQDLEKLELRLHQQTPITNTQELRICPIENLQNRTELSPPIQMETIYNGKTQEYVIDLYPYITNTTYDHYFIIKNTQEENETIELYVRTEDTNCAKINFIFKEIKTTKLTSQYDRRVTCNHQINNSITDGIASLHTPLLTLKGKQLSCELSINYNPIHEQLETKLSNGLPKGWSFNYQQYVGKTIDNDTYYYINGKRQIIGFKKINNDTYIEESGRGMILKKNGTGYLITDLNQTEYHFENGNLTKIKQNNNILSIGYEIYNGKRRITNIIDSSHREVHFTYETGKIKIQSEYTNEIVLHIENNQIKQIYEPNNTNPINNNIYYTYENTQITQIQRRTEQAILKYYPNQTLQTITIYQNEDITSITNYTYKSTYTQIEDYQTENTPEEKISHKYYFNEEKEYIKSVELANGKEVEIDNKEEENKLFIESKEEYEYFITNLLEEKTNYSYQDIKHSTIEDIPIEKEYEIETITKELELYISIQTHSNKPYFINQKGKEYFVKAKIELYNQETQSYETWIKTEELFKSDYNSIYNNSSLTNETNIYMNKEAICLNEEQKEKLIQHHKLKLTLTSKNIMTLKEPSIRLTLKSKHIPIYFTSEKIAPSCTVDEMYYFHSEYPYHTERTKGYGMLDYPNIIKYKTLEGQEKNITNKKIITYKDIVINQKNNYTNTNLFYYNNLKDVLTDIDYETIEIGNENRTSKFKDIQISQMTYQKEPDNRISRRYLNYGYEEKENKILTIQDQIQIYGELDEEEYTPSPTKKEEIKIYNEEGKIKEEISTYNYLEFYAFSIRMQESLEGFTNIKTEYTYDAYGNLTKKRVGSIPIIEQIDPNQPEQYYLQIEEEAYKIEYTYDENHNHCIKKEITENEQTTTLTYQYDIYGNLKEQQIETDKIEYLYSAYFKELVEVKQGNSKNTLIYQNNLIKQLTNTYGMSYQYEYNQNEELRKINYKTPTTTQPLEEYTTIKPKPNNVLGISKGQIGTLIEYNNLNKIGYAYDKYGKLNKRYEYSLDTDQMEPTSISIYAEEKLNDGTSIYEIDNPNDERIIQNELSQIRIMKDTYANTKTMYKYNKDNICIEETTYDLTTKERKTQIQYTIENNVLKGYTTKDVTYGEEYQSTTNYTYNHHNNIKQETITTKTNQTISIQYTYDNYQRIKTIGYNTKTEEYIYEGSKLKTYITPYSQTQYVLTYDPFGRIKQIQQNQEQKQTYTYNHFGYLTKEINKTNEITYSYDEVGNITRKIVSNLKHEPIYDILYTYDTKDKNKLIQVTNNTNTRAITYDEIGNITTYNNQTFDYTRGRLVSKVSKENERYTYTYNQNNQRIKKETPEQRIEYTYINHKLIKELILSKRGIPLYEINYIYTTSKLIGFEYNEEMYFYEYDSIGNIIGIYDKTNTLLATYTYDGYGNHKVIDSTNQENKEESFIGNINKIRYKGYYYDEETKLFYCNSRYYSPELCRFISPDSIEYLDPQSINGLNLYCYCMNNPIMYADPSGHSVILAMLIGAGIGLVVGLGSQLASDVISNVITNGFDFSEWEMSSWQTYLGAGLGGAIGGALTPFLGPVATGFITGASSTVISMGLSNVTGAANYSLGEIIATSLLIGSVSGVTAGILDNIKIPGINSGRGSLTAVSKQINTKLVNGSIKNVSIKTIGKMAALNAIYSAPFTVFNGLFTNGAVLSPAY